LSKNGNKNDICNGFIIYFACDWVFALASHFGAPRDFQFEQHAVLHVGQQEASRSTWHQAAAAEASLSTCFGSCLWIIQG
jgi:hypothetical protein